MKQLQLTVILTVTMALTLAAQTQHPHRQPWHGDVWQLVVL